MRPSSNAGVTRTRREAAPPPAQLDPPPPQPGDPPPPGDPEPPPSPPLDPHSGRMSLPKCTVSKNGKRLHSGRKVINPSRVMTTILKKTWYKHGHSWRFLSEMEKEVFFEEFKKNFRWTASDDLVRRAFFSHASVRYSNTISDIKKKWFKDKKIDESVGEEVMNEWIKVWSCSDYQKMCQQKRKNRLSEPEPGAGPVTHGCGSKPMTEHQEFLTEKEGKTPTVPALFLYTHTINHDGITFVDNKAADTYARFKEILASRLAVDGSNPTDTEENQIWYELVEGEKKQRVYGVGSSAPSYYSDVARFPDQPTPSQANQDFDNLRRAHEKLQDQFRVLQYQFDVVVDHLRTDCPIPLVFSTPAASSPSRPSDDTVDTTDLDDEF